LQKTPERPLVSIVSHGELRVFARRNSWGQAKQEVLQRLLLQCVTLDINHPRVLDAYVEVDIFSQRHPSGARNMGKNDLWIAASALAAGATLLTADRDFEHLSPSLLQAEFVPLSPS
jgi:predicted nucleic acid-binding protein